MIKKRSDIRRNNVNDREKMRALVLVASNHLELVEVSIPIPGPDDVLIRVESCALCSTDITLIASPLPGQPPYGEFIIGHEYSGTVVGLGETVDEFVLGDRVVVEAHLGCLRCANCRQGNYTSCLNYGNREKGHRANGFTTNGGMAQYVINHINTVYKIPDSVDFDEAALITNLGCALYGFESLGGYVVGDSILVVGAGPLGLVAVAAAKALGARYVYLTDTLEARLKTGRIIGADYVLNAQTEQVDSLIMQLTNGLGVDYAVEASGSADGVALCVNTLKRNGKVLLLGFSHDLVPVDLENLGLNNKHIITVRGEGKANVRRAISLLETGRVDLKPLVTHTFPITKIDEAISTFTGRIGQVIKVIIKPQQV
jgi:L-iditol 2-dehydrogenase